MAKKFISNNKEVILSSIGFLFGTIGFIMALAPFLSSESSILYNSIFPILLGSMGLFFTLRVKKSLNDELVKVGLIINPLAIILGIVQLFL